MRVAGGEGMRHLDRQLCALGREGAGENSGDHTGDGVAGGARNDQMRRPRADHQDGVDVTGVDPCPGLVLGGIGRECERARRLGVEAGGHLLKRGGRTDQSDRDVMRARIADRGPDQPEQRDQHHEARGERRHDRFKYACSIFHPATSRDQLNSSPVEFYSW